MRGLLNRKRFLTVILNFALLSIYVGCGGGKEPKPPYDPTADQQKALHQLMAEADGFRGALLADPHGKNKGGDKLMNALLMYMTADNGQSANKPGAMEFLVYSIKDYIGKSASLFSGMPADAQASVVSRLGDLYNQNIGSLPQLGAMTGGIVNSALGAATNPLLPGGSSLAGINFTPSQSFSFNEAAPPVTKTSPFSNQVLNLGTSLGVPGLSGIPGL